MKKILIANRGEIAFRIIRTCREMGIATVAIYSDVDRWAPYTSAADESYHIGGNAPADSYLHIRKIINIAQKYDCTAIHPGYGFLAENSAFARACKRAGIIFIGPKSTTINSLGNKVNASALARKSGVPTLPQLITDAPSKRDIERNIGFPVLIKAAAGGGGRGMRLVRTSSDLARSLREAQSEAQLAFGDPTIFVEKYIERARHIEIQILADDTGHAIHLGERECSIQRRHQKLIEESPSPVLSAPVRQAMGEAAVRLVKAAGYRSAGTVEFLLDGTDQFYFLEVNVRLQVEHPVTEMVTGVDIVREQIRIAFGERLRLNQEDIIQRGHAIECRICAEDPFQQFAPDTGLIESVSFPSGPFVRVDSGIASGSAVTIYYDSMLAKLIVWGVDRKQAIQRMQRALNECLIVGVKTAIPLYCTLMKNTKFKRGDIHTGFLDREFPTKSIRMESTVEAALIATILEDRYRDQAAPDVRSMRPVSPWKNMYFPGNVK